MKSKYQKIKGTFDILPPETQLWQEIETIIHQTCQQFGFEETCRSAFYCWVCPVESLLHGTSTIAVHVLVHPFHFEIFTSFYRRYSCIF